MRNIWLVSFLSLVFRLFHLYHQIYVEVVVILQLGSSTSESNKWPAITAVANCLLFFFILTAIRFLVFESQRLASQLVVKWLLNITMCRKICTSPDLNPRPLGSARRQHRSQTLSRLYYTPTNNVKRMSKIKFWQKYRKGRLFYHQVSFCFVMKL